eukprot:CAMPEP_0171464188 /NCGR_PEP_ID=MMETSP0945-20130129/7585_1 /TAXON_ID=109269 /ORGANISM="Vaucheria litorea, Strain CCMP2940" /LENGTH=566 /DNA_ID=CAMNT_0011991183 /DNA_START=74 /DNA_END=1774 /DNA_ORIENTATION=-
MPIFRHAAAAVDRGRRKVLEAAGLEDIFPDLNTTITIKSSPPKSAAELEKICLKSGSILKRNKQLEWHDRTCMIVPHTFLYYFSDEDDGSPHGILDLELYSEVEIMEGNVVWLHTGEASPYYAREIYLCFDSTAEAEEWVRALSPSCSKFKSVAKDRDDHVNLCSDLENRMVELGHKLKMTNRQRELLSAENNMHKSNEKEMKETIKCILEEHHVGEGKSSFSNPLEGLYLMKDLIDSMKREISSLHAKYNSKNSRDTDENQKVEELKRLKREIEEAKQTTSDISSERIALLGEIQALQEKLLSSERETVEVRANGVVVLANCKQLKEKIQILNTQKKLLAKGLLEAREEASKLSEKNKQIESAYEYLKNCTEKSEGIECLEGSILKGEDSGENELSFGRGLEKSFESHGAKECDIDSESKVSQNNPMENSLFINLFEKAANFTSSFKVQSLVSEMEKTRPNSEEPVLAASPSAPIKIHLSSSAHGNDGEMTHDCFTPERSLKNSWKTMNWRQRFDYITNAKQEGGGLSVESYNGSFHGNAIVDSSLTSPMNENLRKAVRRNTDEL